MEDCPSGRVSIFGQVVGQATAPRQLQLALRLRSWGRSVRGYGSGLMKTVAVQLPAWALRVVAAAYQEEQGRMPIPGRMCQPTRFTRYIGNLSPERHRPVLNFMRLRGNSEPGVG